MAESTLTQIDLKEILAYDPESGDFTWRVSPNNFIKIGSVAGGVSLQGYREVRIKKKMRKAHRLAWLYVHGEWPDGIIDHINQDKLDNRLENLRVVSKAENSQNAKMHNTNTTGTTGVYWHKGAQKWTAIITENGRRHHLGRFHDKVDAIKARKGAEAKYGFHPNHGASHS